MEEDYSEDISAKVYYTKLLIVSKLFVYGVHGGNCPQKSGTGIAVDMTPFFTDERCNRLKRHLSLTIKDA
jgi:hypothetical protein